MSWATTLIDKTHNSSHKKEKREILEDLTEDSGGSDTGAQRGERRTQALLFSRDKFRTLNLSERRTSPRALIRSRDCIPMESDKLPSSYEG